MAFIFDRDSFDNVYQSLLEGNVDMEIAARIPIIVRTRSGEYGYCESFLGLLITVTFFLVLFFIYSNGNIYVYTVFQIHSLCRK